jgi:hypothetical protein
MRSVTALARAAGIAGLATAAWVGVMVAVAGNTSLTKVQLEADPGAVEAVRADPAALDDARATLHLDFVLLTLYGATFVLLGLLVARRGGRGYAVAGGAAIAGALATCVCDAVENVRTLRLLPASGEGAFTQAALDALQTVSYAKWALSALTVALLTLAFTGRRRAWLVQGLAGGTAVAAAVGLAGVLARSRGAISTYFLLVGVVELVAAVLLTFWPGSYLRGFRSRSAP